MCAPVLAPIEFDLSTFTSPQLLLEKERDQLNVHVGELEAMQESQEKQVSTYQGQLAAEQTKTKALENNKREVSQMSVLRYAMCKTVHFSVYGAGIHVEM